MVKSKQTEPKEGQTVKVGSVSLPFYKHAKGWRFSYKDAKGAWVYVTRADKKEALELAREKARELHNGSAGLFLTADEAAIWNRVKALGISHLELDSWEENRRITLQSPTVAECLKRMLDAKEVAAGRKRRAHAAIISNLASFPQDMKIAEVRHDHVEAWLAGERKRGIGQRSLKNFRASAITLFRWARDKRYLTQAEKTAPEQTESIHMGGKKGEVLIYSTEELTGLITACRALPNGCDSLACLVVLGAFAGIRTEEISPLARTKPEGLLWSDVHLDRDIIRIRDHVSKTGVGRVIPMQPNLKAWLKELEAPASGPILKVSLNTALKWLRLKAPHLWKKNALRHSFGTYRTAKTQDMPRVSLEMGNSVEMIKKHYFEAKSQADGEAWFALQP